MIEPTPMSLSIAAWLATYAIHSTILLLAAWLVARRFVDRPEVTSPVWKVAAFGAVVTASFSTAFGVHPLAGRVEVPRVVVVADQPAPVVRPAVIAPPAPAPDDEIVPPSEAEGVLHVRPVGRVPDVEPIVAAATVVPGGTPRSAPWQWPQWVSALWIVGALGGVVSLLAARLRLAMVLRSRRAAPPTLVRTLAELCAEVPGRSMPRLSASDAIVVPFAAGVLRPIIVVPTRAATLSSSAARTMLAHELAHVLRRDPTWRLALLAIERVLFFQPLLRLARRRIEHDAEYLCDAWAAQRTASPVELARCLTEIAGWSVPRRTLVLASSMAEPQSMLRRRVLRLVAPTPAQARSAPRTMPAALVMCGVLPFVAPMVAWADAAAEPSPRITVVMPTPSHDHAAPVVVAVPGRTVVPRIVVVPAPEDERAHGDARDDRRARRKATRALRRAIRDARRDDRLPTQDELAAALQLGAPTVAPDLAWIAEIGEDVAVVGDVAVVDLGDALREAEVHRGLVEIDGRARVDAERLAVGTELDAIIAEADALAAAARANARLHDAAAAREIEQRARALRRRAESQRDVERARRARARTEGVRARVRVVAPPAPPAPPSPPSPPHVLAPLPTAFDAPEVASVMAPAAPTFP